MDAVNRIILNLVKVGNTVEIVPIDTFPNAERQFKVDEITDTGFIYGVSEYCDGYEMPFYWIKEIKIIG